MQLTHNQKQFFYANAYLQIPGVVPRILVEEALRAINHSLGEGMPAEEMPRFRAQSYCPELTRSPAITDLFNKTPALPLAESLIGEGKFAPVSSGQIALRFPGMHNPPAKPKPHIDGMYTPTNGVPEGTIQNFTALACVLLSDLHAPYSGNFTVWPKTHHQYEAYFREHGPQSLLQGMPPIEMPEPQQILGQAGDLVLAHYELAHAAALNVSPQIRYAIFYRLIHIHHADQKWESMTDIWREYEGMREIVAANR